MTLLTPALTPVWSRSSATFLPAFPMITPASFVLTSARRVSRSLEGEPERDCWGEAVFKMAENKIKSVKIRGNFYQNHVVQQRRKSWRGGRWVGWKERGREKGKRGRESVEVMTVRGQVFFRLFTADALIWVPITRRLMTQMLCFVQVAQFSKKLHSIPSWHIDSTAIT